MTKRSKKQLQTELQQVVLLLQQEQFEESLQLLPALAQELHVSDGYRLWAHALQSLGRDSEAVDVILEKAKFKDVPMEKPAETSVAPVPYSVCGMTDTEAEPEEEDAGE